MTRANCQAVWQFLEQQDLAYDSLNPKQLLTDYLEEMDKGLQQPDCSSLKMIPTYVSSDWPLQRNQAALVLDAGGTNLRCALVTLPDVGKPLLECFAKREMPALQKRLSAAEFLGEIAEFMVPTVEEYYRRYQQGPRCLGFCFSYPTQIAIGDNGNWDGKLLQWSKEIKVPELVGKYVGSTLLAVLRQKFGLKAPRHVYIINDTVATLLAGQAKNTNYTEFIGYILGTGINSCYVEASENIASLDSRYQLPRVIINVESGNYSRFPQSQIEKEYDMLTQNPGTYLQEKACSGRYWGELVCMVLRTAAAVDVLPKVLAKLPLQGSAALNALLQSWPKHCSSSPLAAWLDEHDISENARERIYFLTEAMLERSALFTAVNMAACILRSDGGRSPLHPICLTVDGSTFYALHRFELRVHNWLDLLLDKQHYYRIQAVENAPLLGAAIAALGFEKNLFLG